MNTEINIPFEEIIANSKYLVKQAKIIGFGEPLFERECKELIDNLKLHDELIKSNDNSGELDEFKNDVTSAFKAFMYAIRKLKESGQIRNRLCKSTAGKKHAVVKPQKIDDATLFQLSGFALQLGAQRDEKVSIDQALKFLLDHADKTIRFS